jgi:hypothetical protein
MLTPLLIGQTAFGAAGSQSALDDRLRQAQNLWPENPDVWGAQIDAWQFGYEFDPSEFGIESSGTAAAIFDTSDETSNPEYPLWQRAACRIRVTGTYEDCLIGMRYLGGGSTQAEAVQAGREQAEKDSISGWITRGAYIAIGFALFIIGIIAVGFVKPRDITNGLKMAKSEVTKGVA